jgi:hypothetical protein
MKSKLITSIKSSSAKKVLNSKTVAISKNATTTNGAKTWSGTGLKVLDIFSIGGALRGRTDEDVISLFKDAFTDSPEIAIKWLFYVRDIRGGSGERKVFRTCLTWLANNYSDIVKKNLHLIPVYGRWDDLFVLVGTALENDAFSMVATQLSVDVEQKDDTKLSLCSKWAPSINTSSRETVKLAQKFVKFLGTTEKKYRKALSYLRSRIAIVEKKMSQNEWTNIQYDKIPSKAGFLYKNAFKRHDYTGYSAFLSAVASGEKKINAGTLYPYEFPRELEQKGYTLSEADKTAMDLMWKALPNYVNSGDSALVLADVSGSMNSKYGTSTVKPIWVSVSLAIYFAQRNIGKFKNNFLVFDSTSQLAEIKSDNFIDAYNEVKRSTHWCGSTNLQSAFDAILKAAIENDISEVEMPKKIIIVSDMQFDEAIGDNTNFEVIQKKYASHGYKMPSVVFWNVNATNNTSPVTFNQEGVAMVSGASPSVFKFVCDGTIQTPLDMMLKVLLSDRYSDVTV